jgi:hypothetical protein
MNVKERIEELFACAKDDEIVINHQSLLDLLNLTENPPLIFLLDTGNFRVRWKFENIEIGLELLGKNEVEVIAHPKDGKIWTSNPAVSADRL